MAFTVEDGTGLAAANSYVSLADAGAYFADRGNATWENADDDLKEAALVRASFALDGIYGGRWPGYCATQDQALAWPRVDAVDSAGYEISSATVPQAVKNAACEAALVELGSAGALSKKTEAGLSELTVGPITKRFAVASGSGATVYPAITQALSRIFKRGSGIQVVRG